MSATPQQKRFFWSVATVLSFLMLIGVIALLTVSCQKKAPAATPPPPAVNSDVRTRKKSASAARIVADSAHSRNQQTVTSYENALSLYDSICVYLPE